jgi:dTDP-4-amino-4,6-dideoxygalactose transaminase
MVSDPSDRLADVGDPVGSRSVGLDPHDAFRIAIGAALGIPAANVSLFGRGRVALYAILRALNLAPGDEVILPAFTCVAVPNAILYAGARPVYVDIDETTYTVDPGAVEAAIGPRTRVILAQNTFGLAADLPRLEALAGNREIAVVDDCTHGLGGITNGRPNGSAARASFFSTQWSKPLSTGLGGFAVATDPELATRLRGLEDAALVPSRLRSAVLRALVIGSEAAGDGAMFRAGRAAYRGLSRIGVVPASSGREELASPAMPKGFLARMSGWQATAGASRLPALAGRVIERQATAARYSAALRDLGRTVPAEPDGRSHAFLRYAIRANDRTALRQAARRGGIDLGDWFVSPLHPVTVDLERWGYRAGSAPIAERVSAEVVNLPLPRAESEAAGRVVDWLAATRDLIR